MRDMATLDAITSAYRTERAVRRPRTPRTPLLVRAARTAARLLPTWRKVRTTALSLAGFGCLTAAAWTLALPLGLAAAGVSVLLIEYLTGDR
jgi:hypothetical protein